MTTAQLEEMTGYKRHADQCTWLSANGYNFDVRCDGRPNVLPEQVRLRQCGDRLQTESKPVPDLSILTRAS